MKKINLKNPQIFFVKQNLKTNIDIYITLCEKLLTNKINPKIYKHNSNEK